MPRGSRTIVWCRCFGSGRSSCLSRDADWALDFLEALVRRRLCDAVDVELPHAFEGDVSKLGMVFYARVGDRLLQDLFFSWSRVDVVVGSPALGGSSWLCASL